MHSASNAGRAPAKIGDPELRRLVAGRDDVLDADADARKRAGFDAGRSTRIRRTRLRQRVIAIEKSPRLHVGVGRGDTVEHAACQCLAA